MAGKGLNRNFVELLQGLKNPCCGINIIDEYFEVASTYEEMLEKAVGDHIKFIWVNVDDFNNGGDSSLYIYWPNKGIGQIAMDVQNI
jgi:hypothetical protein